MKISEGRSHYRVTQQGREHGSRSLESSRYVGPAPVSLDAYRAMLRWQFANTPQATAEAGGRRPLEPGAERRRRWRWPGWPSPPAAACSSTGRRATARAASAGRSTRPSPATIWIPHCLSVADTVIRMFDDQVHERVDLTGERTAGIDQRWVRVRRPMVVVGGELTLEFLDLVYSPTLRTYEAPPHLKANGGVFLVDDFGRERVSPEQLLNRFITPMEHQIDYLTLVTGQKIQVPLKQVLIIATNLSLEKVTDPAFLRRMGYRLYLGYADAGAVRRDLPQLRRAAGRGGHARHHRSAAGPLPGRGPGTAVVPAARPDRAVPRHLPVPRPTAGVDAGGARRGVDRLLRQRNAGGAIGTNGEGAAIPRPGVS